MSPLLRKGSDLLPQDLIHFEHVDFVDPEDGSQVHVAEDLTFIIRVLELVPFYIYP